MTGPSLAPVIIPIVGTLFLIVWLVVVFYAERRTWRDGIQLRVPGQDAGADRDPESSSGA
jgi:hypothetical protein